MFCEKCGAQLDAGAKFCSVCGQVVGNQSNAEPMQQTQQYDYNQSFTDNSNIGAFSSNSTGFGNSDFGNINNTSYTNNGFGSAANDLTGNQSYNNIDNSGYYNNGLNVNDAIDPNRGFASSTGFNADNNLSGNNGFNSSSDFNSNSSFNQSNDFNAGNDLNSNNGFDSFAYNSNNNPYGSNGLNNNGFDNNGFNNNNFATPGYTQVGQTSAKPKSKKSGLFIGISAALALIAGLVCLFLFVIKPRLANRKPAAKTVTAFTKLADYEAIDMTAKLKLKADGVQGAVFDDFAIVVNSKANKKSKSGTLDLGVNFKDSSIASVSIYYDEEVVILRSDELFEDTLYFNIEDLEDILDEAGIDGLGNVSDIDTSALTKFGESLEKDKNYKTVSERYEKFFKTTLDQFIKDNGKVEVKVVEGGKEKAVKCQEYAITIDQKFITTIISGLLKEISQDKELKALVKAKLPDLLEAINNTEGFEAYGIDADDLDEALESFDEEWDKAMEQLKESLDSKEIEEEFEDMDFSSDVVLRIDDKNRLRQLSLELDMEDSISELGEASVVFELTFNAFDKDVKINKPSTDDAVDLSEMDELELYDFIGEIEENIESIVEDLGIDF